MSKERNRSYKNQGRESFKKGGCICQWKCCRGVQIKEKI